MQQARAWGGRTTLVFSALLHNTVRRHLHREAKTEVRLVPRSRSARRSSQHGYYSGPLAHEWHQLPHFIEGRRAQFVDQATNIRDGRAQLRAPLSHSYGSGGIALDQRPHTLLAG